MAVFTIRIKEELIKDFQIETDSEKEALNIAKENYFNSDDDYVLDYKDLAGRYIKAIRIKKEEELEREFHLLERD